MYIPVRRRMKTGQIIVAFVFGVGATIYAWTPIIKEQIEKQKLKPTPNEPEPKT